MSQFVHLHLHSQYSLLDGANRLDDVLDAAASSGMPAMALTDHGNMFGAIEFHDKARRRGVKPILGIEAYTTPGSRRDRDPEQRSANHLVLLAENQTGYKNLIKLTTDAYLNGYYYKPRMDRELLREHSDGIICLSACLKSEINEAIVDGGEQRAEETARDYLEIFGQENIYFELQDHGIAEQSEVNEVLRRLAGRLGVKTVATNDTHYLEREDAYAHDVLLCIGTQKTLSDPDRLRYATEEFYLKDADEMLEVFPDDVDAIETTLEIAERCDVEIPTGDFHLPRFPVPEGYTLDSYLEKVAREGLERRLERMRQRGVVFAQGERPAPEVYWERLERELETISGMGFPGYFLIVWDFVRHAREQEIPVGPGRGSAAGSLVSFALRITDIDPLRYDLLFERFLNPDRVSMPDIDIDFGMRRRGEVIEYVNEKFGRDRVAQIITFGTLAARAVVRDVGRVMGLPYSKVDRIAKMVPEMTRSLASAAEDVAALKREVREDPEVERLVQVGSRLEGLTRHASMHAAGVVIAPDRIDELVPLCKTGNDEVLTQWDKDVIEELGLLKMDFLGLRTLTVIDDTLQTLRLQGEELALDHVPLDDPAVYELFAEGRTDGIFQFESSGMKEMLRRAEPSRFEDLVAFNALYRPGALSVGMVDTFIRRKRGEEEVSYILPETEPILAETYGVIAYQEQVMQIAQRVAGFTAGEADVLRKAMGKKKATVMAEQKEKFLAGAVERGVAAAKAEALWEHIEPFAGYGFNKSHSVAYAMLAYKTAYLKVHHPTAFMAAMLTSEMSSKDNVAKYIRECRQMEIPVLPPDVDESNWSFTVVDGTIRFGLGAVKGVGEAAVEAILEARRRVGSFEDLVHFAREVDPSQLNHSVYEALIKAGAFDRLGPHRAALWDGLDEMLDYGHRKRHDREVGQGSLFAAEALGRPEPDPERPRWSEGDRLRFEKEALGFFLTGNPLSEYEHLLDGRTSHTIAELGESGEDGEPVAVAGVVSRLKRLKIKSGPNAGRLRGVFTLEDQEGSVRVAIFSDALARHDRLLVEDAIVVVEGSARDRGGDIEITAEEIVSVAEFERQTLSHIELRIDPVTRQRELLQLRDLLVEHAGDIPVTLSLPTNGVTLEIRPAERFQVSYDDELTTAIESILGAGAVVPVRENT